MFSLFVLAIPALTFWTVLLPRLRFSEKDEQLFKAARHGDVAGIERAMADGAMSMRKRRSTARRPCSGPRRSRMWTRSVPC